MALQEFFDSMEDTCEPVTYTEGKNGMPKLVSGNVLFSWSKKGCGFGELYFYFKEVDGKQVLHCENECMSKEFIKQILCSMVDNAVMADPNKKDIIKDE